MGLRIHYISTRYDDSLSNWNGRSMELDRDRYDIVFSFAIFITKVNQFYYNHDRVKNRDKPQNNFYQKVLWCMMKRKTAYQTSHSMLIV